MRKLVFAKDKVFTMTPEFEKKLVAFLPEWIESLLPYYKEAVEKQVDVLELVNYLPMGASCILYEKNGVEYYQNDLPWIKTLGFNSVNTYRKCNWWECFIDKYPETDKDAENRIHNFIAYSHYMSRPFNLNEGDNDVALWADEYFKELIGNDEVGFSLGGTSWIYLTARGKDYIRYNWKNRY